MRREEKLLVRHNKVLKNTEAATGGAEAVSGGVL